MFPADPFVEWRPRSQDWRQRRKDRSRSGRNVDLRSSSGVRGPESRVHLVPQWAASEVKWQTRLRDCLAVGRMRYCVMSR